MIKNDLTKRCRGSRGWDPNANRSDGKASGRSSGRSAVSLFSPARSALWLLSAPFLAAGLEAQESAASGSARGDFQPYIFWAYGLACALLLFFTLWTAFEARRLHRELDRLRERVELAEREGKNPERTPPAAGGSEGSAPSGESPEGKRT